MQNPASHPKSMRTCPTCNELVEPGNTFCPTCGTKIPVLLTCSKCGTQFIDPLKYCDLCGAPLIPKEDPEPDDLPEDAEEDYGVMVEDQMSERDEAERPDPDTDELPDDNDQENIVLAEHKTPHHYNEEIQEPDTDELLEHYGKEYDEDETLESSHTPKPLIKKAKKPVTVPAPAERESSEIVDDVLFMSPKKPESSAKRGVNKTRIIVGCFVLIAIVVAAYFIGLPMLTERGGFYNNSPAAEITPLPGPTTIRTIPPSVTIIPSPSSRDLVPLPTQLIPSSQKLYFQVRKNPVTAKISVVFAGSAGEGSFQSADIRVTHPDGSIASGIIQPLKGVSEIIVEGSKETDRVEIIAQMSNGGKYRVYDALVPL